MDSNETLPAVVPATEVEVSPAERHVPMTTDSVNSVNSVPEAIEAIVPAPPAPEPEKQPAVAPPRLPVTTKSFSISPESVKALTKILGVVKKAQAPWRNTPTFAAFQIVRRKDQARLEAWGGVEVWISATLPDDLGALAVDGQMIPTGMAHDRLRALKGRGMDGQVRYFKKPGAAELVLGNLSMPLFSDLDLPAAPKDLGEIEGENAYLCQTKSLAPVLVAANRDDPGRENLSAVMFELCEHTVVATDGHRLHKMAVEEVGVKHHRDFLVDRAFCELVEAAASGGGKKCEHRIFAFHVTKEPEKPKTHQQYEAEILCRVGDFTLRTKTKEAQFPDWRQVMPKSSKHHVEVPRQKLLDSLGGVMVVTKDTIRGVRLKRVNAGLEVHSEDMDKHVFEEVIPCEGWEVGESTGLNCQYLVDALMPLKSDVVVLGINDDVSPVAIEDPEGVPGYLAIVMPMRL